MEEDGAANEQPITGLGELQVGGGLFVLARLFLQLSQVGSDESREAI